MPKWFLFLFLPFALPAQPLSTLNLGTLVYYGRVIFTAKPLAEELKVLNTPEGTYEILRFEVQQVIKQDSAALPDTIAVDIGGFCFEEVGYPDFIFYGTYHPVDAHSWVFTPTFSGIRPFRGDTAFVPRQRENTICYYFQAYRDKSLADWVFQTQKTLARFDSLLSLRRIQAPAIQNQALFDWIRQHQYCWDQDTSTLYRPFNDCDWGDYKEEVFQWINGNGIWQDAWEGILLSRTLGEYTIMARPTGTSNAFSCTAGRAFLMEQISSKTEPYLGIFMLRNALWTWDKQSQSPPTETERYRAMQIVLPWLKKEQTQYEAMYFIRSALFHPSIPWKDQYGIFPLVELKKAYDATQDEMFKPELERLIREIERR